MRAPTFLIFFLLGVLYLTGCGRDVEGVRVGESCPVLHGTGNETGTDLPFGRTLTIRIPFTLPFFKKPEQVEWVDGERILGRIPAGCVAEKAPAHQKRHILPPGATLREKPDEKARALGRLSRGDDIFAAPAGGGYSLIITDGLTRGFVQNEALLENPPSAQALVTLSRTTWEKKGVKGLRILLSSLKDEEIMAPMFADGLAEAVAALTERGERNLAAEILIALKKRITPVPVWQKLACGLMAQGLSHADLFSAYAPHCAFPHLFEKAPTKLRDPKGLFPKLNCSPVANPLAAQSLFSDTAFPIHLLGQNASNIGLAWVCAVSEERGQVFVADRHGDRAHLGTAFVQPRPKGAYRVFKSVILVGLGACVAIESGPDADSKSGSYELNLACFPPPRSKTKAAEKPPGKNPLVFPLRTLLAGLEKKKTVKMSEADCAEIQQGGGFVSDCFDVKGQFLGAARFSVVQDAGNAVLCLKDMFRDEYSKERINAAFRFSPGEIHALPKWPRACDVDDYRPVPFSKHHP
jgi:hypothetical protein